MASPVFVHESHRKWFREATGKRFAVASWPQRGIPSADIRKIAEHAIGLYSKLLASSNAGTPQMRGALLVASGYATSFCATCRRCIYSYSGSYARRTYAAFIFGYGRLSSHVAACNVLPSGLCSRCMCDPLVRAKPERATVQLWDDPGDADDIASTLGDNGFVSPILTPMVDPVAKGARARLVGVEVEHLRRPAYESVARFITENGGGYVEDGSCGYELVTPPASGAKLDAVLSEAISLVKTRKDNVNSKCAAHVHVDARDLTKQDFAVLMLAWYRTENSWFAVAGADRWSSKYCRPLGRLALKLAGVTVGNGEPTNRRKEWLAELEGLSGQESRHWSRGGSSCLHDGQAARYRAMNVLPWLASRRNPARRGCTIEFRLWPSTLSQERLLMQANASAAIVQWAKDHSIGDAMALPPGLAGVETILRQTKSSEALVRAVVSAARETSPLGEV